MKRKGDGLKNEEEMEVFEKTEAQLEELCKEIGKFSENQPEGVVGKWKLKYVNKIIERMNGLLGEKYRPFEGFEKFAFLSVPTYSDVLMMLNQYEICMDKMRFENVYYRSGFLHWMVNGEKTKFQTRRPKRKWD
jgi:hypothetical protein